MSINRWMGKEDVEHIYDGILLSHKNEWNSAICSNLNGPRAYHILSEVSWPGEGNGNPLHSCLENPMDRGDWWATVHTVTKSWENKFLGRLIRSPGSLRRREGSGAFKEETGIWSSQGGKKDIFSTLFCFSQYNNVSCSRTCFSLARTFWLILSC